MEAHQLRAIAIVLQDRARTLYESIKAIHDETRTWVLNQTDWSLPAVQTVKTQYEQYLTLNIQSIDLRPYLKELQATTIVIPEGFIFPETGLIFPEGGFML